MLSNLAALITLFNDNISVAYAPNITPGFNINEIEPCIANLQSSNGLIVGALDGKLLGLTVDATLGKSVGIFDSAIEGAFEGVFHGAIVGTPQGAVEY